MGDETERPEIDPPLTEEELALRDGPDPDPDEDPDDVLLETEDFDGSDDGDAVLDEEPDDEVEP